MQRVLWGVMSVRGRSEEDLVCDLEMEMEPRDATAGGEDLDDVRQMCFRFQARTIAVRLCFRSHSGR